MTLFKKIPFKCREKDYETRVLYDDKLINIAVFYNNHPANGFRYQVKVPKYLDIKKLLEVNVIENLVEAAKNDIIEDRWEKLLKTAT